MIQVKTEELGRKTRQGKTLVTSRPININSMKKRPGTDNNQFVPKQRVQLVRSVQKKDHLDLFFESCCSSIKSLTPQLIAEAKVRFSQLVCELELRAITENGNQNSPIPNTVVVSSIPTTDNAYVIHQPDTVTLAGHYGSTRT